jgi:hypothetical protein
MAEPTIGLIKTIFGIVVGIVEIRIFLEEF